MFRKLNQRLESDGFLGVLEAVLAWLKKKIWSIYYHIRLPNAHPSTVFTGPISIQGGRNISIGPGCTVEAGVRLMTRPDSRLEIHENCYLGSDVLLNAEGSLTIQKNTFVLRRAELISSKSILIGPHAWIARDCRIEGEEINIEEGVILGPGVSIITGDHAYDPLKGRFTIKSAQNNIPVRLQAGCWIGTNAVLLKGVTVGTGAVVGAGAVVTKSIPSGQVAVGVPANCIKALR